MNTNLSWIVYSIPFLLLVAIQYPLAYQDRYLSHAQLLHHGIIQAAKLKNPDIRVWSLLEHPGIWLDWLIAILFGYVASKYSFDYGWRGAAAGGASVGFIVVMLMMYGNISVMEPDHCAHDGHTTISGYIHAIFAGAIVWMGVQILFKMTTPSIEMSDILIIGMAFGVLFFVGPVKMSTEWRWSALAIRQVQFSELGLVAIIAIRLLFFS